MWSRFTWPLNAPGMPDGSMGVVPSHKKAALTNTPDVSLRFLCYMAPEAILCIYVTQTELLRERLIFGVYIYILCIPCGWCSFIVVQIARIVAPCLSSFLDLEAIEYCRTYIRLAQQK